MRPPLSILCSLLWLPACTNSSSGAGQLSATWTFGELSGQLASPIAAVSCPSTRLVELTATRGDTGVAILLFPTDTVVTAGNYPVFPTVIAMEPRPGAMVALRWFESVRVEAFESIDGEVVVEGAGSGGLSGRFSARLLGVERLDTVMVHGSFSGVTPPPAGPECGLTIRRNLTG